MRTQMTTLLLAQAQQDFDPSALAGKARAALIAFLAVVLVLLSLAGVFKYARKGDMGRSAMMVGAALICLIPAAITAPLALGRDLTGWLGW